MNWLILFSYLVQGLVVVFFPVPSEASSLQLLRERRIPLAAGSRTGLLLLGGLGMVTFHLPLLFVLTPGLVPEGLSVVGNWQPAGRFVLAAACLVCGNLLSGAAVLSLQTRRRQPGAPIGEPLRTTGIYGRCRHPINLGLMLLMAGFFLVFPLWIMAPGVLAFFSNLHIRGLLEESFLEARYGEDYRRYRERVPRYGLPFRRN